MTVARVATSTHQVLSVVERPPGFPGSAVGHRRRRAEGTPLLEAKFFRHISPHFTPEHCANVVKLVSEQASFEKMPVDKFMDLFVVKA